MKDAAEFLHAMKFDKPILVGHSMGAATVMRVGGEYTVTCGDDMAFT